MMRFIMGFNGMYAADGVNSMEKFLFTFSLNNRCWTTKISDVNHSLVAVGAAGVSGLLYSGPSL